jgi:hypothetical protein
MGAVLQMHVLFYDVIKYAGKRLLGRTKSRWENSIKIHVKEIY